MATVLLMLGFMQYHWSIAVSRAAGARMTADLNSAVMEFREDLARELGAIAFELQPQASPVVHFDEDQFLERFRHWQEMSQHRALVSSVYVWEVKRGGEARLMRVSPDASRIEPAEWPANFSGLRDHLQQSSSDLEHYPLRMLAPGRLEHERLQQEFHREHHYHDGPRNGPVIPWVIDETIPALVRPVVQMRQVGSVATSDGVTFIIAELNLNTLRQHMFPELARRYFGGAAGLSYEVAVIQPEQNGAEVIYSSDAGFGATKNLKPDAAMNLWGPPMLGAGSPSGGGEMFRPVPRPSNAPPGTRDRHEGGLATVVRFETLRYSPEQREWQIVVKHRKGSVEAAVTDMRRKQLAISLGTLLLLAATTGLLVVSTQRARRLAQLQMEFVAGVSHELRTPLAVISSAAENIADGVVADQAKLARYSNVIRNQARQLARLVEQVLLFASTRQALYQLRPTNVRDVIESALDSTADFIKTADCEVERRIDPDLPFVSADFGALSHCLQNLITNAAKYGKDRKWIGIRASSTGGNHPEVAITVDDRGIGIDESELPHIFEPFYRSPSVASSEIHGTGLGLTLAKSIAEAMGGRVTVTSQPGKGAAFTVHLPAMPAPRTVAEAALDVRPDPKPLT